MKRKQLATTFQYLGTAPSQHRDGFLITSSSLSVSRTLSRTHSILGRISYTSDATLTEENSGPGSRNRQPPGCYVRSTPRGRSELDLTSANAKRKRPDKSSDREWSPRLSPPTAQSRPSVLVPSCVFPCPFSFAVLQLYSVPCLTIYSHGPEKSMSSWRMVMPIDRFISAGMRRQRQSLSSCSSVNRNSSLHLLVVRLFTFSRGPRGSVASSSSS